MRNMPMASAEKFATYKPREEILRRAVKQAKCAIGSEAYPIHNENRVPLYLLDEHSRRSRNELAPESFAS